MNGKPCWEVECIHNTSAYQHETDLAAFWNEGWEIVTNGMIYDPDDMELTWYATARRLVKSSRLATSEFERSLLELAEGESEQEEINHAVLQ